MSNDTGETLVSKGAGGAGTGTRQKLLMLRENEKENIDVNGEDVGLNQNKSPLPVGYPRFPLQDITEVLRPLNDNLDEEPNNVTGKPFTRSQGLRKTGSVRTTVLFESNSTNVTRVASSRADPSKNRKKQVIRIAIDESKTVILPDDPGQVKEGPIQDTKHGSSSVNLTEQTQDGHKVEDIFSLVEVTTIKTDESKASGSLRSVQITHKEKHVKTMQATLTGAEQRIGAPLSVQITHKDKHVKTIQASFTDTEQRIEASGEPLESSASGTGPGNQFYQDHKRRKPLSGRSSVSRFR